MSQIFISYARKDSDEVYPIVDMLESNGFKCWIDKEGIESGSPEFENVILDAIDSSEVFLHMLSPNSKTSKYVKEEYKYAADVKKRIVTVLLHGAKDNPRVMFGFQTADLIDIYNETQKEKLLRDLRKWVENDNPSRSSYAAKEESVVGINEVVCSICGKKGKLIDGKEVIKDIGLALMGNPLLAIGSGTKKVYQKMSGGYICPECKTRTINGVEFKDYDEIGEILEIQDHSLNGDYTVVKLKGNLCIDQTVNIKIASNTSLQTKVLAMKDISSGSDIKEAKTGQSIGILFKDVKTNGLCGCKVYKQSISDLFRNIRNIIG